MRIFNPTSMPIAAVILSLSLHAWATEAPQSMPLTTVSLEEAHKMAARNNPTFENIGEQVNRADAAILSAWSMLLPRVSATGSIVRNEQEITMTMPDFSAFDPADPGAPLPSEEIIMQEKWGKSFGLTATMTLFDPRSIPLIKNAHSNADKARLEAQQHKSDLLFAVTSAYYQVHAMKEMIRVWQENLTTAIEFQRQSKARQGAGQSTRIDVLRAEIQVTNAQKGLENARDAFKMAKSALAHLIGMKGDFEVVVPGEVPLIDTQLDQLYLRALRDRVDLKAAAIDEQLAARNKVETWMKWLPSFDATYDWRWNEAEGFAEKNDTWMFIVGVKWQLFDGGRRLAEMKARQTDIRMAKNTSSQLTIDIRQEVESSYLEMIKLERNVELAQKQVLLAEQNHALVSKQFDVGLATSLDLQNAAAELATQRNTRVIERLQYDIAKLGLKRAVGNYHALSTTAHR
ncbi:MAG: TolC family protein [Myxococcota bacterium]|nr:TolC family protein [Myxococcota bacterium]